MSAPLAERLRPKTIDDYIGQEHLVGKNGVFRKFFETGNVPSFILWGPPGVGKTCAARLALEAAKEPFHHIHGAGKDGYPVLLKLLQEKGVDLADHPALQVREYIYDMATVMRAADLVLCRAGASTISELTALGVPALIVPSPYVTNNHQEKNARVLENAGGAAVLLEKDCSGQALFQAACGILHDGARRASMERAMSALGIRDATERIYQTVLEICQ